MASQVFGSDVTQIITAAQSAGSGKAQVITLGGANFNLPQPFPSPIDWRDCPMYMLMIDRFNNPVGPPAATAWNVQTTSRQGGTFNGVTAQLPYLRDLGIKSIWITPVLKNPGENAGHSYYGYGAQDFINLDKRFASDGTLNTAEKEYRNLIDAAHGLGLYIVQDIVINHAARVFNYFINNALVPVGQDPAYLNAPLGQEPSIEWLDGSGTPNPNWINQLPAGVVPGPDDLIWPAELQDKVFFRRQGQESGVMNSNGFIPGDFFGFRQLVAEYNATQPGQEAFRAKYGANPVLSILIRSYQYLIAKYDIDAFRIDTAEYVEPDMVENFCNAMREYGLSVGKKNFFAFGEITSGEDVINRFVGRHSSTVDSGGLDAVVDYPLFWVLPGVVKALGPVDSIYAMFNARNTAEEQLVSSHAEAGRYFVSFLDNHDQYTRFNTLTTPPAQVTQGLAVLYTLQGIPCLYYGTEQGLTGISPSNAPEAVREALWGKPAPAFDETNSLYLDIQKLIALRTSTPALRYGRLYFRQVSQNGYNFGQSFGVGGLIAFSRMLCDTEVVVVANTSTSAVFQGFVLIDLDANRDLGVYNVAYSNLSAPAAGGNALLKTGVVQDSPTPTQPTSIACLYVILQPMEVQILL